MVTNYADCLQCGTSNPQVARFCMACGSDLGADGDHAVMRFVTAVFCDIAGSTQLSQQYDPQVWNTLLDEYFTGTKTALTSTGGRVEKFIGDAVVAVYGAVAAEGDEAPRAVMGAASIRDQLEHFNRETAARYGAHFHTRTGIASGRVVTAGRDSSFAIGSVMNKAARLQSSAPLDGIGIDVRTWFLVRDRFHTEELAPVRAKGFDHPLRVWSADPARPPAPAPQQIFVNQKPLLETVTGRIDPAGRESEPLHLHVFGDMGVGKSSFLLQLEHLLRRAGLRTVPMQCPRGPDEELWQLREIDEQLGSAEGLPVTSRMFSVRELQWQVRTRLSRMSTGDAVVYLVDDADLLASSVSDFLTAAVLSRPGAVLVTSGSAPLPNVESVAIPPLDDAHAGEFVELLRPELELHSHTADATEVIERAHGNPLYIEQLAALAESERDLLPPAAEAVFGARIAPLTREERMLLAAASILGIDRASDLFTVMTDLDDEAVFQTFDRLQQAAFVGNRMIGEVSYQHLTVKDRIELRIRIAATLAAMSRTDPQLLLLAVQNAVQAFEDAVNSEPDRVPEARALAVGSLLGAARYAIAITEPVKALDFAEQAIQIAEEGEETASHEEAVSLHCYALAAVGRLEQARKLARRTRTSEANASAAAHLAVTALVLGVGDPSEARRKVEQASDPMASMRLTTWDGILMARKGDYPGAVALLSSAHHVAREYSYGLGTAEVYGNLSLFTALDDRPVMEALDALEVLTEEVRDTPTLRALIECSKALVQGFEGSTEAALDLLERVERLFTDIGYQPGRAQIAQFRGNIHFLSGDMAKAAGWWRASAAGNAAMANFAQQERDLVKSWLLRPDGAPPDVSALERADDWEARLLLFLIRGRADETSAAQRSAESEILIPVRGRAAMFARRLWEHSTERLGQIP
ncbi:hypothetical protein L0U85_15075 [Glycomyces sp. L485]|uniref:adenylate/guanylate cyclase domain-containing protein n=1 Tax=Glycomyces sp. L485 TaxID=2909235 RepID=UPI001F4B169D|nr:adenylate/guanylate cyclase domain-containing protein [Glycomyces sp. L485]MCH7232169.1 hypothetical protein [Glycomyces sp. L485]